MPEKDKIENRADKYILDNLVSDLNDFNFHFEKKRSRFSDIINLKKMLGLKSNTFEKKKEKSFEERKKELELDQIKKDHDLKISIAVFLKRMLLSQSLAIFVLVALQGFSWKKFKLDNYIFYILISGVLTESYFLVKIVVQHLFPSKDNGEKENKKSSVSVPISKIKN